MSAPAETRGDELTTDEATPRPRRRISRRRLRTILLLAGVIPAILAFVLLMKVAVMLSHASNGTTAFDDEDYPAAAKEFAANKSLNWFEPWVAPFNEATARHAAGEYDAAIALYATALKQVPAGDVCLVRTNLALAYEARGDAAHEGPPPDIETALKDWQAGMDTLTEGGCATDPGPAGGDANEGGDGTDADPASYVATAAEDEGDPDAQKVAERLREKLDTDTDQDGLTDAEELSGSANDDYGNQPTDRNNKDSDGDGLTDGDEIEAGTDPNNQDTDGGGATDGSEVGKDRTDPLDKSDDKRQDSKGGKGGEGKSPQEKDLDKRNQQGQDERKDRQEGDGGTSEGDRRGGSQKGGGGPDDGPGTADPDPSW